MSFGQGGWSGLQIGGGTSATFSGTITALAFVSTQASGSNGFTLNTAGARFKFSSGGTTDYFSSDGAALITAAGSLTVVGAIASGSSSTTGTASFSGATSVQISHASGLLWFSNTAGTTGRIVSAISAANAGATAASAAIKIYPDSALDAADWVMSVGTSGNAASLLAVDYSGKTFQPTTDSSGTPGAATINKPSGVSAIATGASSVVISNTLVTATGGIFISPRARDATGLIPTVTARTAATSFTVSTTANCTADLIFDWWMVN